MKKIVRYMYVLIVSLLSTCNIISSTITDKYRIYSLPASSSSDTTVSYLKNIRDIVTQEEKNSIDQTIKILSSPSISPEYWRLRAGKNAPANCQGKKICILIPDSTGDYIIRTIDDEKKISYGTQYIGIASKNGVYPPKKKIFAVIKEN